MRSRRARWLIAAPALAGLALACASAHANPPAKASRAGAHGAIAYHADSGAFGYSYDFKTSREAKQSALANCANPECIVLVNFRNACAALVQGPKRPFISQGTTRDEAQTRAMQKCNDKNQCKPVVWACTR